MNPDKFADDWRNTVKKPFTNKIKKDPSKVLFAVRKPNVATHLTALADALLDYDDKGVKSKKGKVDKALAKYEKEIASKVKSLKKVKKPKKDEKTLLSELNDLEGRRGTFKTDLDTAVAKFTDRMKAIAKWKKLCARAADLQTAADHIRSQEMRYLREAANAAGLGDQQIELEDLHWANLKSSADSVKTWVAQITSYDVDASAKSNWYMAKDSFQKILDVGAARFTDLGKEYDNLKAWAAKEASDDGDLGKLKDFLKPIKRARENDVKLYQSLVDKFKKIKDVD